jgi:DNA primase
MNIITAIKEKVSLEDIAKENGMELTPKGPDTFFARCIIHQGDTQGSFHLQLDKKMYFCYSCRAKGDVIDLLQHLTSCTRNEAIHQLALRAGIPSQGAPKLTPEEKKQLTIKKAFQAAQDAYTKDFWVENSLAHQYMKGRGISDETLRRFGIGYSSKGSYAVSNAVKATGLSAQNAASCGVLALSDKNGGKAYDPMFGRVVFPIFGLTGNVVGFSGRLLPPDDSSSANTAKYKNTAASETFQKRTCLYGLKQATQGIRREKYAILVEGYLDVLAMHDAGFDQTAGTMGTAVTSEQLQRLYQHTHRIIFLMDGDKAGRKATIDALEQALAHGFLALVVYLENGDDPASFLQQENGAAKLKEALQNAEDGLGIWLNHLNSQSPVILADWTGSFLNRLEDKMLQLVWARRISSFFGVSTAELLTACREPAGPKADEPKAIEEKSEGG